MRFYLKTEAGRASELWFFKGFKNYRRCTNKIKKKEFSSVEVTLRRVHATIIGVERQ